MIINESFKATKLSTITSMDEALIEAIKMPILKSSDKIIKCTCNKILNQRQLVKDNHHHHHIRKTTRSRYNNNQNQNHNHQHQQHQSATIQSIASLCIGLILILITLVSLVDSLKSPIYKTKLRFDNNDIDDNLNKRVYNSIQLNKRSANQEEINERPPMTATVTDDGYLINRLQQPADDKQPSSEKYQLDHHQQLPAGARGKAIEQILRQYYIRLLGKMIINQEQQQQKQKHGEEEEEEREEREERNRKGENLLESRVMSKRDREILPSEVNYRTIDSSASSLSPSSLSSERKQQLEQTRSEAKSSFTNDPLDDHYQLIESYARNPFDFAANPKAVLAPRAATSTTSSSLAAKRRFGLTTNKESFLETILNEIVLDQMLHNSRHWPIKEEQQQQTTTGGDLNSSRSRINEVVEQQESRGNTNMMMEQNDRDKLSRLMVQERLNLMANDDDDASRLLLSPASVKQQQSSNNNLNLKQQMKIQDENSLIINSKLAAANRKEDGRDAPELHQLGQLLLRPDHQHLTVTSPNFASSLASPLAFDANFPKRQIRFHQCYFNPISCFKR